MNVKGNYNQSNSEYEFKKTDTINERKDLFQVRKVRPIETCELARHYPKAAIPPYTKVMTNYSEAKIQPCFSQPSKSGVFVHQENEE